MEVKDTLINQYYQRIPEYYPGMYREGFEPWEVYSSFKRKMLGQIESREDKQADDLQPEPEAIMTRGELYLNGKKV